MRYNPAIVLAYFRAYKIPKPTMEYQFHETRKWRFDIAWPAHKVALEVDGGGFVGGRHSRGAGMVKDMEKYNTAVVAGWRILRVVPRELCMMETVEMLRKIIGR